MVCFLCTKDIKEGDGILIYNPTTTWVHKRCKFEFEKQIVNESFDFQDLTNESRNLW
jgi:hypothetical protein